MRDQRACNVYMANIGELALSVAVAALIANQMCINCFLHFYTNQFINAVVYGMMIMNALMVLHLYLEGESSDLWALIVASLGAILFLTASVLILQFISGFPMYANGFTYLRLLMAGLFGLLLSALYLLNVILLLRTQYCNWPIICQC